MNREHKIDFGIRIGNSVNVWFYSHFPYLIKSIQLTQIKQLQQNFHSAKEPAAQPNFTTYP